MEEVHPRRSSGRRKHRRRAASYQTPYSLSSDDSDDMTMVDAVDVQANSTSSFRSITKHYTLLFLKVGLWLIFAWALSHLHLRAPYFLLPVPIWFYSGPVCTVLNWVKRRLRGPVA